MGVAVSWENRDAYYIALTHENPQGKAKIDLHAVGHYHTIMYVTVYRGSYMSYHLILNL